MSEATCHACGADIARAMTAPDPYAKPGSAGDPVVAGMVGFVEAIESGVTPLTTCGKCGKTSCRSCARRAAVRSAQEGYACPGCRARFGAKGIAGLELGLQFARAIGERQTIEMKNLLKKVEKMTAPPDAVVVAMKGVFEGSLWMKTSVESIQSDVARRFGVWGSAAKSAEATLSRALAHLKAADIHLLPVEQFREATRVKHWLRFALERIRGNQAGAVAVLAKAWGPVGNDCVFMFVLEDLGDDAVHAVPALTAFLEGQWAQGLLRKLLGPKKLGHEAAYINSLMIESAERTLEAMARTHNSALQWFERAATSRRMPEEVRKLCADHAAAAKAKRASHQ